MLLTDALLSPREYLTIAIERGEIPSGLRAPAIVIFVQQKAAFSHLLHQYRHHKGSGFLSNMAFFENDRIAAISGFGLGGAPLAAKMEELIAWGVKRFIYVGVATPLSSDIALFSLVAPQKMYGYGMGQYLTQGKEGAIPAEGWKKSFYAFSSKEGVFPRPVSGFSSDFLLAPASKEVQGLPALEGLDVLDMASHTFYALGQVRQVECLSLLVTSDCLCDEQWIPSREPQALLHQLMLAVDISYGFCLENLS